MSFPNESNVQLSGSGPARDGLREESQPLKSRWRGCRDPSASLAVRLPSPTKEKRKSRAASVVRGMSSMPLKFPISNSPCRLSGVPSFESLRGKGEDQKHLGMLQPRRLPFCRRTSAVRHFRSGSSAFLLGGEDLNRGLCKVLTTAILSLHDGERPLSFDNGASGSFAISRGFSNLQKIDVSPWRAGRYRSSICFTCFK